MIKELLAALIDVDPDWDSQENQENWQRQRVEDETDGEEDEPDE